MDLQNLLTPEGKRVLTLALASGILACFIIEMVNEQRRTRQALEDIADSLAGMRAIETERFHAEPPARGLHARVADIVKAASEKLAEDLADAADGDAEDAGATP